MGNRKLTIGHLAREAGVNVETVRYYQRMALIQEPRKPLEGYRHYPLEAIDRLKFIKRAQQLGFSLKEIAELLELGDGNCKDVRTRAEEKRAQIDQQIRDLKNLRKTLDTLIQTCQTDKNPAHCPIVENLSGKQS
ncbi:MAG: Hg(II)-responsive transcriptional regulator [Acidiferrobacterales bacterium]